MSTRTKEEFEQLGYTHASNGDVRSYKSTSTSWQGIAYNAGVMRFERGVEIGKQPAWEPKPGDKITVYGGDGKPKESAVVAFAYREMGKSRMAEMMREAGYTPPQSPPEKPIKIWFDELLHDKPANRWSTEPGFVGWPVGAVAHLADLTRQLLVPQDPKRTERLRAAIDRLHRRHGAAAYHRRQGTPA